MMRCAALALMVTLAAPVASAQERVIDAGTLLVAREGVPLGREEFTVRRGRPGAPDGYTISVRSFYPPDRAEPVITPQVELRADSHLVSAQIGEHASERRVFVQADARRVTVRSLSPAGESVRQYPASARPIVMDDWALALLAVRPVSPASAVAQIWPRGPRRTVAALRDLGTEATAWQGGSRALHHLVLEAGGDTRHLWYDAQGRLMKVEIPAAGVEGVRAPEQP